MEVTGYTTDQVHVLRQTFRPNEPFQQALEQLTRTGLNGPRPLRIYGSDERIVELSDLVSSQLALQLIAAEKKMNEVANTYLQLGGEIAARVLTMRKGGAVALQLLMKPRNVIEYAKVRGALDTITVGRPGRALGLQATQLYMTIPIEQLRDTATVRENLETMNQTLRDDRRRFLYQLTPNQGVSGYFVARASREVADVTHSVAPIS
jgi:hypothetical protein